MRGRPLRFRSTAILALVLALAGCATIAQWRQSAHVASIHRQQNDEANDRNTESKAERASQQKLAQHDEALHRVQVDLVARGDPDSLAASALIDYQLAGSVTPTSVDLAARAVAAAPQRADLAYVLLQLCESTPDCKAAPLEARLLQLDPGNGMPWVYTLARADHANVNAPWRAARDALSRSQRITTYWNSIVSHLTAAVVAVPAPAGRPGFDTVAAMIEVVGVETALVPELQPIARACSVEDIRQAEVLTQCRQIAGSFMKADTVLLEAYGSTLGISLWPAGSTQSLQITAERRGLRYRMEEMSRLPAKFNSPAATRTLAAYVQRYPSEQTALRALFADLGVAPDPPPKWVDDTPGG
jgi:hypothetical protein